MNYPPVENEAKLVKSLSRGNILAFNTLFRKYSGRLNRFAYGYLKSDVEAEELVQEVFKKIWEKRKGLKSELSFKAFLFTIAFNIIKKRHRKEACLSEYYITRIYVDFDLRTTDSVIYNSLFQYVTELVNLLPEKRREIFIKSRFEGMSIREISDELNISHKTVENQLTKSLKFIRTNLKLET